MSHLPVSCSRQLCRTGPIVPCRPYGMQVLIRGGSAVGVVFTAAVLAVAAFGYLLIPPLVHEVVSFGHDAPALLQKLTQGHGRLGFLETRFHVVEHARH